MVSVIVPVFNVEFYLHRCVDSIISQSYSDLEIILIDDGSTDNSGQICDEYAFKDPRIVVIHKENGGLSSARNAGLERASGDYLAFIDSDDWVDIDFISLLVSKMSHRIGIAVCGLYRDYINKSVSVCSNIDSCMPACKVLESGITSQEYFGNYFCNKMFSKGLFENITFPEGALYEDIALFYKVLLRADSVAIVGRSLYHYFQGNSVAITKNRSMRYRYEYVKAQKKRWKDLVSLSLDINLSQIALESLHSIVFLCASNDFECNWMYDDAVAFTRELEQYGMKIGLKTKAIVFFCIYFPRIFNYSVKLSKKYLS